MNHKRILTLLTIFVAVVAFGALLASQTVAWASPSRSTFVVSKTTDTNDGTCDADCSLREAIQASNFQSGTDTIMLGAGVYQLTIEGSREDLGETGDLDVYDNLIIQGAGIDQTVIEAAFASSEDRILHIHPESTTNDAGAEFLVPEEVMLSDLTIRNGVTAPGGSVFNRVGGGIRASVTELTLNHVAVVSNTAGHIGGGISIENSILSIINGRVEYNQADYGGGGINLEAYPGGFVGGDLPNATELHVQDSSISQNLVLDGFNGGGIYKQFSADGTITITISSSIIHSNVLSKTNSDLGCGNGHGGGIFIGPTINGDDGNLSIVDSTISNNRIEISEDSGVCEISSGGGIYFDGNSFNLENSTVVSNTANVGGGIHIDFSGTSRVGTILNSNISYNQAIEPPASTNPGGLGGGGMYVGGEIHIDNTFISHNAAFANGGGIYGNDKGPTISNTRIIHNSAQVGGGIYGAGQLNQSTVHDNHATDSGGGVGVAGDLLLEQSTIHHNSAENNGGGIHIAVAYEDGPILDVINSTVSHNSAAQGGGIHHNVVSFSGRFGAYLHLKNSTIANNSATDTGGLYSYPLGDELPGETTFINTLLADNTGGNCNSDVDDKNKSLGHNLSDDSSCAMLSDTTDINRGLANIGPLQDNGGATWTHALLAGSEAIDGGDDSDCPATDQRGIARPFGAACDIGAFEVEVTQPFLYVNPQDLIFSAIEGATAPPDQALQIENSGGGTLNWTATESLAWLSLGSSSGTAPAALAVSIDSSALAVGTYTGDITLSSDGINGTVVVAVTLIVSDLSDLLQNGDFEAASDGAWQDDDFLIREASAFSQYIAPRSGQYAVLMGGNNGDSDLISQTLQLPTGVPLPVSYYYYADSTETQCRWDNVQVRAGNTLLAQHDLCQANNTTGWVQNTVSLDAFAGQSVDLTFHLQNDALENPSVFLIDDVMLGAGDSAAPIVTSNYYLGAPGSYFDITGLLFPPNSDVTVTVGGQVVHTTQTDAQGRVFFVAHTDSNTPNGSYSVQITADAPTRQATSGNVQIELSTSMPTRANSGNGTVVEVPNTIVPTAVQLTNYTTAETGLLPLVVVLVGLLLLSGLVVRNRAE